MPGEPPSSKFKTYQDYLKIEHPSSKRRREEAEAKERPYKGTTTLTVDPGPTKGPGRMEVKSTGGNPTTMNAPMAAVEKKLPQSTHTMIQKTAFDTVNPATERTSEDDERKMMDKIREDNRKKAGEEKKKEEENWEKVGTDGENDENVVLNPTPEKPKQVPKETPYKIEQVTKKLQENSDTDWANSPGIKNNDTISDTHLKGEEERVKQQEQQERFGQRPEDTGPSESQKEWMQDIGYNAAWLTNKAGGAIGAAGKGFGMLNGLIKGVLNRNLLNDPTSPASAIMNTMVQADEQFAKPALDEYAKQHGLVRTKGPMGWELHPDLEGTYHGGRYREKQMQIKQAKQNFNKTVDDALKYAMGDDYKEGQDMSEALMDMTPEQVGRFYDSINYAWERDKRDLKIITGPDGKPTLSGDANDGDRYSFNAYHHMLDTARRIAHDRTGEYRRQSAGLKNERAGLYAENAAGREAVRVSIEDWKKGASLKDRMMAAAIPEFVHRMENGQYKVDKKTGQLDPIASNFTENEWRAIRTKMEARMRELPEGTEEYNTAQELYKEAVEFINQNHAERMASTDHGQRVEAWNSWAQNMTEKVNDKGVSYKVIRRNIPPKDMPKARDAFFAQPQVQMILYEGLGMDYLMDHPKLYDAKKGIIDWRKIHTSELSRISSRLNDKELKYGKLSRPEYATKGVIDRFVRESRRGEVGGGRTPVVDLGGMPGEREPETQETYDRSAPVEEEDEEVPFSEDEEEEKGERTFTPFTESASSPFHKSDDDTESEDLVEIKGTLPQTPTTSSGTPSVVEPPRPKGGFTVRNVSPGWTGNNSTGYKELDASLERGRVNPPTMPDLTDEERDEINRGVDERNRQRQIKQQRIKNLQWKTPQALVARQNEAEGVRYIDNGDKTRIRTTTPEMAAHYEHAKDVEREMRNVAREGRKEGQKKDEAVPKTTPVTYKDVFGIPKGRMDRGALEALELLNERGFKYRNKEAATKNVQMMRDILKSDVSDDVKTAIRDQLMPGYIRYAYLEGTRNEYTDPETKKVSYGDYSIPEDRYDLLDDSIKDYISRTYQDDYKGLAYNKKELKAIYEAAEKLKNEYDRRQTRLDSYTVDDLKDQDPKELYTELQREIKDITAAVKWAQNNRDMYRFATALLEQKDALVNRANELNRKYKVGKKTLGEIFEEEDAEKVKQNRERREEQLRNKNTPKVDKTGLKTDSKALADELTMLFSKYVTIKNGKSVFDPDRFVGERRDDLPETYDKLKTLRNNYSKLGLGKSKVSVEKRMDLIRKACKNKYGIDIESLKGSTRVDFTLALLDKVNDVDTLRNMLKQVNDDYSKAREQTDKDNYDKLARAIQDRIVTLTPKEEMTTEEAPVKTETEPEFMENAEGDF